MKYLLDTNIISALVSEPHGPVAQRALERGQERLCTSIVVVCELWFGVIQKRSARLEHSLRSVLGVLPVVQLEAGVELHSAEIRARLERKGSPLGSVDLFIAAHARSLGAVLVTRNERAFRRVPGLDVENWYRSG
ncbi:MAG: type II toxin-antitoxin system VapC family toxin [Myxococcaceae bacterium]|nr:type II toxin-antitoxin system VapC family toxin [Myxococcaceae bacterium]